MLRYAVIVLSAAAIATGFVDLIWRDFDPAEQVIHAWGNTIPGERVYAVIVALVLIAGGAALFSRRTAKGGAVALGLVYFLFALFPIPRFVTAPRMVGYNAGVYIGVLDGICQNLIIVAAMAIVYAICANESAISVRVTRAARVLFGLSCVDFGLAHLSALIYNSRFVPAWLPIGREFWVGFTGAAFILAGIAIFIGVCDVLAARLLAVMLLVFSALTLAPMIAAYSTDQGAWGANVYNIAAIASAWVLAEWLAKRAAA